MELSLKIGDIAVCGLVAIAVLALIPAGRRIIRLRFLGFFEVEAGGQILPPRKAGEKGGSIDKTTNINP